MTQDPNNSFVTPPGRIVGGSLSVAQTKGHEGQELATPKWVVMLALPKGHPGTAELIAKIKRVGAEGFVGALAPQLQRPDFAWKIIDGDSAIPNQRSIAPNTREGYPGHFVLTLTTTFAFQTCGENPNELINAAAVQNGSWVRIAGDVKANGSDVKPGVYLNLKAAQFVRNDAVIQTGGAVTAAQAFGGAAAPAVPVAAAPAVPATDIVTNAVAPPPPPPSVPTPPQAPTGPALTAKGVAENCDIAAWGANGWTEDTLRQHGYIV